MLHRRPLIKGYSVPDAGNLITDRVNQAAAGWTQIRTVNVANSIIAPDGTKTAAKLVPGNTSNTHITIDSSNSTTTVRHKARICAKAGELTGIEIAINNSGAFTKYLDAIFDLRNGSITAFRSASYTGYPYIDRLADDWFEIGFISTNAFDAGAAAEFYILPTNNPYATFFAAWTGDTVKGLYTWGAEWFPI